MPKPPLTSEPPSSPARPAAVGPRTRLVHRVLKLAAFVVGLPAAVLSGMAVVGSFTENGYARVLVSALVVLGLPLLIADRLLPSHDPTRARGLVSDVCAVTWMLLTCVAVALGGMTRPLLAQEGDRLVSSGHADIAQGAYLLAGVRVEASPAAEAPPAPSSSASDGAAAADAGAAPAAVHDGGAAADAGAAPARPPTKEKAGEKSPAELFKEASPAVVTLSAFLGGGMEGGGTGFLIDKDGTIATNHHVIRGAARMQVKFQGGAVFDEVELLVDDATVDLALLRVNLAAPSDGGNVDAKPLPLGNSDDVVVGEHAVVIGNPLGLDSTLTDGLVSSRRVYEGRAWIQFSAPIGSGNSGGPVLNMRGEVIGVTTASLNGAPVAQNLNLAVPINELKKLIRAEYPSRRKLGAPGPGHW